MDSRIGLDEGERLAVLESKFEQFHSDIEDIKEKLDELLHFKSKGMGAIGLVSVLIGSGMLGIFIAIFNYFAKPHL